MRRNDEIRATLDALRIELELLRKQRQRMSKTPIRNAAIRDLIRRDERAATALMREYCSTAYAVDLTVLSVKPCSSKTSRYLRNREGYHSDLNLICAWSETKGRGYALFTNGTQITRRDVTRLGGYVAAADGETPDFYTDNRHRCAVTMPKAQTQVIERKFSLIKRDVYGQIKNRQKWDGRTLTTDISRDEFLAIYQKAFGAEKFQIVA